MSVFKSIAARTSAALRKLAREPKAQAAPAETLSGKLLKAITPAPKPYRIAIRQPDGSLKSVPATAEEAVAYCNGPRTWRRIG